MTEISPQDNIEEKALKIAELTRVITPLIAELNREMDEFNLLLFRKKQNRW